MDGFHRLNSNEDFNLELEQLDDSQKASITSTAPKIVIRAPAGSGKTKTLITAVANYRYEHINARICAITYTRAAREEMESRLNQMGVYDVEVTTIHVWARNLLQHFAQKYDFKVEVLEEAQIKGVLNRLIQNYLLASRRVRNVNVNVLYSFIAGNKNMDISDSTRRTFKALETRYIDYKRLNHLYDFTDYPLYLWDVMETYKEYIYNIDALFVDEFQDVDPVQLKTFERVKTTQKFYIGDPWQSIFAFRGADGDAFNKLDNFTVYKLKYNYRSYQEIIDYSSTVYEQLLPHVNAGEDCYITQVLFSAPSSIHCAREYGGSVIAISPWSNAYDVSNGEPEIGDVTNALQTALDRMPVILCRTNKQVKALEGSIYDARTIHSAKGLEFDNVIVVDSIINDNESLNIAYVALTRARDNVLVVPWTILEQYLGV